MRLWTLLLLGVFGLNFAQAGIFDFKDVDKAKEAYKKKNYDATIAHLNSLKDSIKDPALEYDLGNAYYKKGKYKEALKHYEKAKGVDEANRLYNTGNAYANSGDIKSAIDAYEQSLKIRDDADTRKNLEILKQKKKEQDQKDQKNQQDKKDEKNQDQNKQNQDKKDQQNQDEKNKNKQDQNQNKQDKEKQNQKNQDQKKDDNASQKKSPEQDKKESSEDQKKSENKEQEKKDTKGMTPREKKETLSKKQIKHLMEKLKSKEMPTMMYESGNPKEREDDEKPW